MNAFMLINFQAETSRSLQKHRKTASSFRDNQLFEIFQLGCNLLRKASEMIKTIDFQDDDQVNHDHIFFILS